MVPKLSANALQKASLPDPCGHSLPQTRDTLDTGAPARMMTVLAGSLHGASFRVRHDRLTCLAGWACKLKGLLAKTGTSCPTGRLLEVIIGPDGRHALPMGMCITALTLHKLAYTRGR
jgi:hypothetical protein